MGQNSEHIRFHNWLPVRDALESAYAKLGLEMVETGNGSREYPAEHWNIAGLVYEYFEEYFNRHFGRCIHCDEPLNYRTVIRCLDCKATLCERCAKDHFGPGHDARQRRAHCDQRADDHQGEPAP